MDAICCQRMFQIGDGNLYALLQGRKDTLPEGSYTTYLFQKGLDKILPPVSAFSKARQVPVYRNGQKMSTRFGTFLITCGLFLFNLVVNNMPGCKFRSDILYCNAHFYHQYHNMIHEVSNFIDGFRLILRLAGNIWGQIPALTISCLRLDAPPPSL